MRADAPVFLPRWTHQTIVDDEPISAGEVEPEHHDGVVLVGGLAQHSSSQYNKQGSRRRYKNDNNKKQKARGIQSNNNAGSNNGSQELSVHVSTRGKGRRTHREKTNNNHGDKTHANKQHVESKKDARLLSKSKVRGRKRIHARDKRPTQFEEQSFDNGDDNGEESSFPSLLISEQYTSRNCVPVDSEKIWSIVAKDGHMKSEIRNLEQIREYERVQKEKETYSRMDILTTDRLVQLDGREDAAQHSLALKDEEKTTADEKIETIQIKFLNLQKLREKWYKNFDEWKHQVSMEQEMVKLQNQEKHDISCEKESWHDSEESSTDGYVSHDFCDSVGEHNCIFSTKCDSLDCSLVCEKYLKTTYPLHFAIIEEDEIAIEAMMRLSPEVTRRDARVPPEVFQDLIPELSSRLCTRLSVLQLAIIYGKPHLLRVILSSARASTLDLVSSTFALDDVDDEKRTPLMLACTFGLDDCISVLLSFGPKVAAKHAQTGDNALHLACRFGKDSTVKALLGCLQGPDRLNVPKGKLCWRQRLVCGRNRFNETPLHIACERGSIDLVQALLSSCSISVSEKALAIENNIGQTPLICSIKNGAPELVAFLLTWRGNQRGHNPGTNLKNCPLVAAAETKSIEMLQLILEHRHLSVFEAFDYSYALFTTVSMFQDSDPEAIDAVRLLIVEGANPYQRIILTESHGTCAGSDVCSSITYAALQGYTDFVSCMIDTYQLYERKRMKLMTEDPCLRMKALDYFQSIEREEQERIKQALEDTLVKTIICSFENPEISSPRLGCCLSILERGGCVTNRGLIALLMGLRSDDTVHLMNAVDSIVPDKLEFEASFQCEISPRMNSPYSRPDAHDSSQLLLLMDWFRSNTPSNTDCNWINKRIASMKANKSSDSDQHKGRNRFCFINANGPKVLVHQEILMKKSGKIEAAIRFEEMKQASIDETYSNNDTIEIFLDISVHHLCFLLQHCYHGSIFFGLPADSKLACEELLDLYHLAIEYLCPSLALECELRLLAENPYQCFCSSCAESKDLYSRHQGERSFRVKGPSKLLNPNTYLNVISYTDNMEVSCNYNIIRKGSYGFMDASMGPLSATRAITWKSILFNFDKVLKTDSFLELCHSNLVQDEANTRISCDYRNVGILLLRTVLDELRTLPLDLMFMKRKVLNIDEWRRIK